MKFALIGAVAFTLYMIFRHPFVTLLLATIFYLLGKTL